MRRPAAVERKIRQAFKPMPFQNVSFAFKGVSKWGVFESSIYLTYRGVELRFDWGMDLLHDPLPKVGEIRDLIWQDIEFTTARLKNESKSLSTI